MDGPVYTHTGRASEFAERFLFWVFGVFFQVNVSFLPLSRFSVSSYL